MKRVREAIEIYAECEAGDGCEDCPIEIKLYEPIGGHSMMVVSSICDHVESIAVMVGGEGWDKELEEWRARHEQVSEDR